MHIPAPSFLLLVLFLASAPRVIKNRTAQMCSRVVLAVFLTAGVLGTFG